MLVKSTALLGVDPVNDPPLAVLDTYQVVEDELLTVTALAGVLANDSDIDGDSDEGVTGGLDDACDLAIEFDDGRSRSVRAGIDLGCQRRVLDRSDDLGRIA